MDYHAIITIKPGKRSGKPCIRGLRIPVAAVVGMLANRMSAQDVLTTFPDLEPEDVDEALRYASRCDSAKSA